MGSPRVSFIIPALNEAPIIVPVLQAVSAFITKHRRFLGACQVIVVASGKDKTAKLARQLGPLFDDLKVITPRRSGGKGADVRAGFAVANGDVQLFFDADLSTPLPHLLTMIKQLRGGADVAIGARNLRAIHPGKLRTIISVGTNLLTRPLLPRIKDTQCGCKGFTKAAAQQLFDRLGSTGWGFDSELLVYARRDGLHIAQVAIPDWRETRDQHLAGENVVLSSLKTFGELARLYAWALGWWAQRHYIMVAVLAAAFTFIFSLAMNPFASMWFDETYTAMLVKQPVDKLVYLTSVDVHPPFYYLLLKGWAVIFGQSDIALRSLSMIAGALASGVGLLLVRRLFNARVMLATLPFVVLAPFLLRYDIEARMYALASLIGVVATYALVVAVARKRVWPWVWYGVMVLIGMFTLYYLALVWLVHAAWIAWRHANKQAIISIIAADTVAGLLFIPWFLLCWPSLQHAGLWLGPPSITDVFNVISLMLGYMPVWALTWLTFGVVLAGLAAIVTLVVLAWRHALSWQKNGLALLIIYAVLPCVVLVAASTPPLKPVFLYRYFAPTLIGAYLLAGVAAALVYKRSAFTKGLVLIALSVLILGTWSLHSIGNENLDAHRFPRAKETVAFLQSQHANIIVADTPELYFELDRYMPDNKNLYFFDGNYPVLPYGGLAVLYGSPQQVQNLASLHDSPIWFVYFTDQPKMQLPTGKQITQVYQNDKYHVDLVDLVH